jgi:CRISPR/Cas system CMR subunit Cmr4 (Cas7 group RAMP superfamily)
VEDNLYQLVDSVAKNGEVNSRFTVASFMREWFGDVGETSVQSRIVTAESDIEGAAALPMTRNKINRFDGSTIQGALYSELSYYGGTTSLEILVKKPVNKENDSYLAMVSLLQLTIENIQKGYLALGGQVAIGRGIFEENGSVQYSETIDQERCAEALYRVITKGVSV